MQITVDDQGKMAEVAALALFEIKQKRREGAIVLALYGDLGAGKTTFVQALAKTLGVTDVVPSPTFILLREYTTTDPYITELIHIDAYRLEDPAEIKTLAFDTVLKKQNALICVEWADRIEPLLPEGTLRLHFSHQKENERVITFD